MLNTDESTVVEVPGMEKSLDKIVGLPDFSTQLSNLQMRVPELSFQEVGSLITTLFQRMDASFYPANVSTSVPSEPKEFVLNVESLTVSAVAGVSYGINAVGEGFQIVVVDTGGRWNVVTGHKESLPPIN